MKRLAAIAMAGTMVFGLSAGTTAMAADKTITSVEATQNTADKDVKATYDVTTAADTVYSVDVTWGSMEFTYKVESEGTWNPATHAYDNVQASGWSAETGADQVTVVNHSNAGVNAAFSYVSDSAYSGITGTFANASETLATAEGTTVADAPSATSKLTLSGALNKSVNTATKIGTATVTLTAAQ